MVRRRGGTPGGYDPGGGSDDGGGSDPTGGGENEDTGSTSPSSGGGGGDDPDPPDDDGPRSPGGSPSFPGTVPDPDPPDSDPPDDDPTGGGENEDTGSTSPGSGLPDDDPDPSPGPSSPGGSPSVPGGVDPEPPEPDPDPSPGPSSPGGSPSVPGGVDPEPPEPEPPADPTAPEGGSGDATGRGNADTSRSNRGAAGDIDFRFADQFDALDSDPEFRTDSGARGVAEELLARGRRTGDRLGGGAADAIGADAGERRVLQSFTGAGTTLPGSAAFLAADAADAGRFVTEPARSQVEPGALLGFGDLADIGAETATRAGEVGAAAGDSVIEGTDRVLDIDFSRRAAGEGAAISFTDDPQARQELAGSLAFGAASLGAAGPASSATRGAVGAASRGARSAADAGSTGVRRLADDLDAGRFVDDTRAQQQVGGQRERGERDTGPTRVDADDIEERDDMTAEIARQTQEQTLFEQEQRFGEIERDSVPEATRDTTNVRDTGRDPGGGVGGAGEPAPADGAGSFADNFDAAIRASNTDVPGDDLRRVVDVEDTLARPGGRATSRFSSTGAGAGAGAAGVGDVSQSTDPTGIAPQSDIESNTATGAGTRGGTGAGSFGSLGQLSERNDPSGVAPTNLGGFGEQRLGGGTLPDDAAGGDTDTGRLDETNDPTNIAPPGSRSDTGADTDTFAPTDTGTETGVGTDQPPVSDTDQPQRSDTDQPPLTDTPPVTDTPTPPVTDTPPVTRTPPTQTPRPPRRPPVLPPARPPTRRPPRRPPEEEEERDRERQREPEPDAEFGRFDIVDTGGPAVGFGAETFTALATGPFEERQVAEGSPDEFFTGELPAASFLNPDDDDEEGVEFVSGLFGLNLGFGGGGPNDA